MFMYWLMDQNESDAVVYELNQIIFNDYNNGCLSNITSAKNVLVHFLNKHPKRFVEVRNLFEAAIKAYDAEGKK